jgi:hypothetical protein
MEKSPVGVCRDNWGKAAFRSEVSQAGPSCDRGAEPEPADPFVSGNRTPRRLRCQAGTVVTILAYGIAETSFYTLTTDLPTNDILPHANPPPSDICRWAGGSNVTLTRGTFDMALL